MKKLIQATFLVLLIPGHGGVVSAQSPADATAEVQARVASYVDAFNRRDVEACVEHWSTTAEYIVAGSTQRLQGRAAIGEALGKLLDTDEQFELSMSDQEFRMVASDVLTEEGTARLVSETHGIEQARYLVVHVKQDAKWYRDSLRETVIAVPHPAEVKLDKLKSLVGHWKHEYENGSVDVHGQWINNKRFVSRAFEVSESDGYKITGTEIIGWDPQAGLIRSWSFDSEGGFEQAVWDLEGESWLIKVHAVFPNGSTGTEQRVLTSDADGNLSSEVIEQAVEGQLLPGSTKVTLVRQPEK